MAGLLVRLTINHIRIGYYYITYFRKKQALAERLVETIKEEYSTVSP